MLHLAQVQNNDSVGGVELQLLARLQSEHSWAVIKPEKKVPLTNTESLQQGWLVLVDLSENQEVLHIQHAKDWVLDFVQKYLTIGVTPGVLNEEVERSEQWRQDLTVQSQDLTRRNLEVEARREQIQTLEEELKREKQQLEREKQQMELMAEELALEKQKLQKLAEQLKNKNASQDTDCDDN